MIPAINRRIAFSLMLVGIVIVIVLFDTVLHLLIELIHVLFELIEQSLDMIVEHIFHTDGHETQIIVFYIMAAISGYALYKLYKQLCTLPSRYRACKESLSISGGRLKKQMSAFWQGLSPSGKIKWLAGFAAGIACLILWLFM